MHAKDLYDRLAAGYSYDSMYGELCNERDRLKKENAKLRELVVDMCRYGLCECEHKDDCQMCEFAFPKRMKELGLEWGDFNV